VGALRLKLRMQHSIGLVIAMFSVLCSSMSWAAVTVQDDLGRTVTLAQPAQRVIALAPHIVEMVYAVGSGDKLVGAVSYSNYPEAAKALPQVGTYKDFSSEAVLRLQPDLVLAWSSGNTERVIKQLRALGIAVYVSEPRTLESIGVALEKIGVLTGAPKATSARRSFDETLKDIRLRYAHQEPVSVFYQVWNSPLQTLNGQHMINDVIELCGGRNIFEHAPALAPKVNVEAILRADPQLIFASGMGEARPEWLNEWLQWPSLQAVKNKQLHFVPPDYIQRHTPRVLLGAAMLCDQLQQARTVYGYTVKAPQLVLKTTDEET